MAEPLAHRPDGEDETEPGIDVRRYVDLFLRQWKLIVATVVVAGGVALLRTYLTTPIYRASAILSVEREQMTLSDLGVGQGVFSFRDPDFIPTQIRIIKGRDVLEHVVNRKEMVKSAGEGADAEAAREIATSRVIRGLSGGLEVSPVGGTSLIEVAYQSTTGKVAAEMANAVADAYVEWSRESRIEQANRVSRFLEAQVEQLKKDVEEKNRRLAEFSKTRDMVSTEPGSSLTTQKVEAFNKDYLAAVAERVNREARYQQVVAMSPESIADQDPAVAAARSEQQKLEREYAEKLSIWKPDFPAMKQLKARIQKGQSYLEGVAQQSAQKEREKARVELESARKREEVLRGVLRSQTAEALGQNTNAVEYTSLRVETSASRALLESMLQKQAQLEVESRVSGMRTPMARVVERAAEPEYRWYPSYRKNVQKGLVVGLFLGAGLVLLIDFLDRSVRTQDQVEKVLGLPALGVIPSVGSGGKGYGYGYGSKYGYGYGYGRRSRKKAEAAKGEAAKGAPSPIEVEGIDLVPHLKPRSIITEAYRAFRTLLLLSRAGGLKSVVITSAIPGEGKTTTALNLAVTLAQLGKRVVLIDADLHKPRVHQVLKISNRVGLVSVLAEGVAVKDALQTTVVPNLWVIPSGPLTPNPSGLLASDAMKGFLTEVFSRFDYVVFDSPPVQPVADALLLGSSTDGVVLTVRGGKTPREVVGKAKTKLMRGNVPILGVLINNLRLSGKKSGGGYGGYAKYEYGYGYGYGATGEGEAEQQEPGKVGAAAAVSKA